MPWYPAPLHDAIIISVKNDKARSTIQESSARFDAASSTMALAKRESAMAIPWNPYWIQIPMKFRDKTPLSYH